MPGKRGNGEGSVRQRPNGLWEARITLDGKSRSFFAPTRAEAVKKLTVFQHDRDIGKPPSVHNGISVEKYLVGWLEMKRGTLPSPRTYDRYREYVTLHLIPALGRHEVASLSVHHVQKLYSEKRATLAPRTVNHIHAVLHNALEHAMKQGLVYRNVTELAEAPKVCKVEMLVWTQEEARAFLRVAESDRYYALYATALATTMRQSELFGLHWRDIDLEAGVVNVKTAVRRSRSAGFQMAIPKTDSSRRVIPIDPTVVGILKAHKERQDIERETLGDAWRDNDLVFPDTLGGALRTSNLERQRFGPMMAKAGVPRICFHDMRHTAATLLISSRGVKTPGLSHGDATPRAVRRSRQLDTKRPRMPYLPHTAGPAGIDACGGGFGPRHDRVRLT